MSPATALADQPDDPGFGAGARVRVRGELQPGTVVGACLTRDYCVRLDATGGRLTGPVIHVDLVDLAPLAPLASGGTLTVELLATHAVSADRITAGAIRAEQLATPARRGGWLTDLRVVFAFALALLAAIAGGSLLAGGHDSGLLVAALVLLAPTTAVSIVLEVLARRRR